MKVLLFLLVLGAFGYFFLRTEKIEVYEEKLEFTQSAIKKKQKAIAKESTTFSSQKGSPKDQKKELAIKKILESTHTIQNLHSIDFIMEERLKEARIKVSPEEYSELEEVIDKYFNGKIFTEKILKALALNLSEDEVLMLQEKVKDPLLSRAYSMENYSSGPEGMDAFKEFVQELNKFPPDEERVSLMKKFDSAVKSSQSHMDINQEFLYGILLGSTQGMEEKRRPKPEQLETLSKTLTKKIKPAILGNILNNTLFTYQELTNEEILELIEKEKAPILVKVGDITHRELKKIFRKGGQALGQNKVKFKREDEDTENPI